MGISTAAWFPPFRVWLPLALPIGLAQFALVRLILRPDRNALLRASLALGLSDAAIVLLLRGCVAQMGVLDYSERFLTWRLWFLALGVILVPLPVLLWVVALKLARAYRPTPGATHLIHPIFKAALGMWLAATLITLALGGEFTYLPRAAKLTYLDVPIQGLPRDLEGFRIVALADLHVGELMTPARVRKRLTSLARVKPDLEVILGDITYQDPGYQSEAARLLGEHAVHGRTFAVSGNFDVAVGTDSLREELRRVGITYLENDAARVRVGESDLWVVGVGDPWSSQDQLDRALKGVPPGAIVLLLSHSPDLIEKAAARHVTLMLSGHLHGGQITLPFAGPALGMSRYGTRFVQGVQRIGGTTLVVSRGLAEEAAPLRLFTPPEVLVISLRRAEGAHTPSHNSPGFVE